MKELDNSLDKQSSFRARGKCRSRPKTYFFTCGKQCKNKYGIFSGWNEKNFHLLRQLEIFYAIIEKSSSEM